MITIKQPVICVMKRLAKVDYCTRLRTNIPGSKTVGTGVTKNFLNLNSLVWRHFPISSLLLFNDVAGHAWRIVCEAQHAIPRPWLERIGTRYNFPSDLGVFPLLLSSQNAFESSVALLFC